VPSVLGLLQRRLSPTRDCGQVLSQGRKPSKAKSFPFFNSRAYPETSVLAESSSIFQTGNQSNILISIGASINTLLAIFMTCQCKAQESRDLAS
jgi:hypothetical protein